LPGCASASSGLIADESLSGYAEAGPSDGPVVSLDELRVILGNAIAIKAFREGTLPFPDGAIIAKLGWKRVPSVGDDGALGAPQAFVPGAAALVQIMIKDSKKYAMSGGWGFGRFHDGKPLDEAQHETCFPCHAANAKAHDLVFTRYAS